MSKCNDSRKNNYLEDYDKCYNEYYNCSQEEECDSVYKSGYDEGLKIGYNKGKDSGYKNGYSTGYKIGFTKGSCGYPQRFYYSGFKKGFEKGREVASKEAFIKGLRLGMEKAYEKGVVDGYNNCINEKKCHDSNIDLKCDKQLFNEDEYSSYINDFYSSCDCNQDMIDLEAMGNFTGIDSIEVNEENDEFNECDDSCYNNPIYENSMLNDLEKYYNKKNK